MSVEKYHSPRAEQLYEQIFRILEHEEPEIGVSVLINLLQTCFYAFALENKMDSEKFIVYVNAMVNELKKELFSNERMENLDDFYNRGENGQGLY